MASREGFPESLTELSREALMERVRELEAQLAEAQAQNAELRRQLFGSKAEKLSPEQQAQMDELASDLQQEAQQPPPLSPGARTHLTLRLADVRNAACRFAGANSVRQRLRG